MIGKKERDFSLDVLRVLACFLVILLHVGVFYYQTKDDSNHVREFGIRLEFKQLKLS